MDAIGKHQFCSLVNLIGTEAQLCIDTHMHATAGNFFNFSYLAWEEEILSGRIFRNLREYLKQYPVHMKPEPVATVGSKYEPKRRQRK